MAVHISDKRCLMGWKSVFLGWGLG